MDNCQQELFVDDKYLSYLGLGVAAARLAVYDWAVARIIGDNLKELRGRKSLTQEQLAERLKHSEGRNATISKWENDPDWLPSRTTINSLCTALDARPSDLFRNAVSLYDRIRAGEFDAIRNVRATSKTKADRQRPTINGIEPEEAGVAVAAPEPFPGAGQAIVTGARKTVAKSRRAQARR